MKRVLFLCSGNYYRSRYAETFFNWRARECRLDWLADSRGLALHSNNVGPISHHALDRMRHHGMEATAAHRLPLAVTLSDFMRADRIVAIKRGEHRVMLERQFPAWLERTVFWDIHDLDCQLPEVALPELEAEILRLINGLNRQAA
jgi:protein-tyrosine phosphatase